MPATHWPADPAGSPRSSAGPRGAAKAMADIMAQAAQSDLAQIGISKAKPQPQHVRRRLASVHRRVCGAAVA